MKPTERAWRLADCRVHDTAEDDGVVYALHSEGSVYAVSVIGPKGMTVTQMTDALRAALCYALKACGARDALPELKVREPAPGELDKPTRAH
jgi:hypothetical protein